MVKINMAKKIKICVKLQVSAGMANPSPPIGPTLGQHGVNIMEFCKAFNLKTENLEKGLPIPVLVTIYSDRSFTFITKTPPASVLLKKAAGMELNSSKMDKKKFFKVTNAQILEIAKNKSPDMTGSNLQAMFRSIVGTARSMGLEIKE